MSNDDHNNLPSTSGANLPTTTAELSLKYLGQRFGQWQNTQLHGAEARLIHALAEYKEAGVRLGKAELDLNKQLAENQAYDFDQDVRMHRLRADITEIELSEKRASALFSKKISKKENKLALKNPSLKRRNHNRTKPETFTDQAKDILEFGLVGKNQKIAEEMIAKLVENCEADRVEDLPLELRGRVADLRREALRADQSKDG